MRAKVMWSISNKTTKKAFWAAYNEKDDLCRSSLRDLDGELGPGLSIDIDVEESRLKIGFWSDLPVLAFGGTRITEPELVDTNRSVALVEGKKHKLGPVGEFSKKGSDAVTFLDSHAGRMSDIDIVRAGVTTLLDKIPYVGGGVAFVIGLLWPEEKRTPEDLMRESEERMKRWVQGLIHSYDLQSMSQALSGLRRNLKEYSQANSERQREEWMEQCIASFNTVIDAFIKSNYTPGTLMFTVSLATLHLALLRERALFCKEIYGDEKGKPRYLADLKTAIDTYVNFVGSIAIPGELVWRDQQIEDTELIGRGKAIYGYYVKDVVTREVQSFAFTGRSQIKQGPAKVCVDYYRAQARNSYERELLAQTYDPALLWNRLHPDHASSQPIKLDRVVWTGPYAGLSFMVGNEHDMAFGDSQHQGPGKVTAVRVRSADRIDALRFDFAGHDGRWFGNTSGGTEHVIKVADGVFLTAIETWWNFDLFAICLYLSDGTNHKFGKHGRGEVRQYASYPDHRISAVRLADRLQELYVGFSPLPDYYERLQAK
jgi:delta endotoxin, N-terminal domain